MKSPLLRLWSLVLLMISSAIPLQAAAVNVRIVGLSTAYCAHDVSAIATQLNGMLAATPGYSGSSAAATVFSGRSLTEAYYHPSYRVATRAAVVGDYDYLIILPETTWLYNYPEMTFDGVLQMSRKALAVGTTPLLLMPGTGTSAYISTLGTNSYRIGNGCGIHVVPGGYAAQSANQLSMTTNQAYLLAATIFTKITGLNAASGTSYVPASVSNYSSLAGTAVTTNNTHNTTTHYTTSRENSGLVRYRNIIPAGNSLRFAKTGTSTEQGISVALTPIFQASGYSATVYSISSEWGWTSAMATTAATNFATYPGQYTLGYFRSPFIAAASTTLTSPNQPNMLTIAYDQQYTGMSNTGTLEDFYDLTETARGQCVSYGFSTVPVHLGAARLNDVDSSLAFSGDGTHWNPPFYNMIAAMMATTSLGREPTPTAAILADSSLLKGFNVGKQLVRQLAFLSETEAHCPDTALAIAVPPALTAVKSQAFTYNFTATGGTAPYAWTVESSAGLPAGLTLSPSGSLSGITTADEGNWQLVIQVKDSTGAIRKIPATLAVALSGTGAGTLAMTSGDGLSAYGNAGGPFSPTSQVYTLSNVGTTSINWAAAKTQSWVTLTPASGTLAAGANTTVTVSINSNADALAANTYTDTVTFTNTTNNNGNTSRGVSLTINSLSTNLAWDANGTTAGQTDGAGAWLSANQWWNGTANANWTSSRNATFGNGGAGGAVTLSSPTTVNALGFNAFTGTYTLGTSGQTLTLNGGITVDAAAGAVSLVSPVSLGFPQTWANHSASTLTASSAISGSGGLTKSGSGTMVLAPDTDSSSYAGATTVSAGVLNIQKSTALGSVASGTTVNSGATLQIQGGISVGAEALALDGSGVSNAGALRNISGTNFYNGLLTLNGATRIQSDAGTLVLGNTGTITGSDAALTVGGAGHTSIMGNIATGSGSLTKEGNGTLTLYGVSTYSGGTTINGGHISLATSGTDSLGAANSSVTVNASTTLTANGNTTLQKSFAIHNSSTLSFANASSHITVTGAVSGNGGVRPIGGATSLGQRTTTLSSTSNSFTGPISNPSGSNFGDLSVNSLYDGAGAGNITFGESGQSRTMRLQLGSGATGPLTLSNRRIVLVGTTPTANISNNNGTAANAITIQNDLLNSQTGAGTLELGGYNTGNNRFLGNITNGSGGGTLGLTKGGPGVWALSGTNTYSGTTILGFSNPAGGALVFQGMQSLPSGTKLQQTNSGGTGGFSTVKLLDDSATPPSRTGVNLAMLASSSTHNMTLFVGNNSTANGGTSSSTQTGSTIALGNLDFIQNSSGNTSQTLTVNGANGYGLSIQNIDLPSLLASSTTWAGVLNPTSAPLTVSGNVRQKAGSVVGTMTLKLDGTASGNQLLGTITDSADAPALALAVSKTNTSIWTLSGTNTYTGTTTITAGKLFINGNQTSASGAVSVAANATLGGTGTIGGSTTIAAGGKLEFALSSTAAGHDKLELASGKSLTFSGASTLTITSPGGASPGTYTLITAPGGISGVAPATLNLPAGWAATVSISGTNLLLNVTSTGVVTPGALEVTGADGLASSGYVGGPFSPGSVVYTLRNTGQTSIDWTAGKTAAWLNLSSASGTLAPNASTTVTVSINSAADSLAAGSYNDTVSFTNTSNGNGNTTRAVSLNAIVLPTYDVTYNGNGNSGGSAPSAQIKTYNINLTLSGQGTLVRSGYSFTGWNTAADGSGNSYAAGAIYTANAAITLFAQWEPLVLAVVTDKGTVSVPEGATSTFRVKLSNPPENTVTVSVSRISGDTDIEVQSGSNLSFTTSNWSTYQTVTLAAANDTDVDDGSAIIRCDANDATYLDNQVTAVEADKHTTLTLANDGNGTTSPSGAQVVEKDAAIAIAATANEGYDFTNWTVTSGSATIDNATSASTTVTVSGAATVRANFALKTYNVTYNGNGNSGGSSPAAQTKNHGENLTLATNTGSLTKTGYTFSGWNTAADGSGTDYAEGASYTQNASLTLHAKWAPNTYLLTFDSNGGTVADPATKQITFGSAYGPLATTNRAGYSFNGWFTAVSEGTQVDAATLVATAENHTLYAQWTADTYTVTYNGNGNSGGTVPADQSKVHDVNLTLATNSGDLAKSGFTFAGWNTAEDGSGTDYAAGSTYSANAAVTLFAKWEPGADGTWIQTTAGPFNWGDSANWSGGAIASGADRTANFTANITPDQTVTLEAPRTIGGITFTDSTTASNNLTLSGTNTLTLSRSFDNPVINVTQSNRTLTISCPIAGSNGLQKNGAGTLILSNTGNSYTGGTIINGGIMSDIRAGSFGSGPITVAGSSSFAVPYGAYPVLANSIAVNSGATATFSLATQYYTMTFDGELSGEGTVLVSGGNGGATFRNDSNTFTGTLTANNNGITLNSLPDSTNPIQLNGGSLTLGAGSASPLLFDSRNIQLTGTTNGGRITNNNATAANSIIINTDLLITGTGNKTLTLSGTNTGDNVFAGNIADAAGSVISLSKLRQSGGTWALSGTNTYSGATTLGDGSGTLIIRGKQALSPNSTVVLTQSSSSAFYLKLLDDTAGTVSLPNTFGLDTGNSSMGGIIFVGNNNTANGGNGNATTTGSTISLNKVTPWNLANNKSLHGFKAEGANGYTLGINNLEIPAFSSTTFTTLTAWTMQLTANSAPIAITGTVQQLAGSTSATLTTRTFEFGGSNGSSRVSGAIKDSADGTPVAWKVIKSGTGTWDFSGTNSYTGTTAVNAGKLFINGDSSAATGAISVASNATLGGNGAVGGSVTIASGGKLEFDLSAPAVSHNPLNLSAGKDFTLSGTSTLTITSSGGATTGTYTLVTGGNNIGGAVPATLVLPTGWAATVSISGNSLQLNVTSTGSGAPGSLAIIGTDGLSSSGFTGGPFSPGSAVYTLYNPGETSINWTGGKTAAWVNLSATSGTLAAGANTTVTVSINSNANSLAAGSYSDTVTFTNTTNNTGNTTRSVALTVNAAPTYTVSYNGNGNTGGTAPSDQTKNHNVALTLSGAGTLTRTGYSFSGWNTAANGTGAAYAAGASYTDNASVTLYAQWTLLVVEMDVTRDGGPVADGGYDLITGTTANVAKTLTYAIANSGESNLTLESAVSSAASNCTVVINTQPASPVAPAGSTNLVVAVTPTTSGAWSFNLSIANNDSNETPYNWTVHGVTGGSGTVSVVADRDTYINKAFTDTTYGSSTSLALNNHGQQIRQGLINFTLPAELNGAAVTAASVKLYSAGGGQTGSVEIFNATGAWDAGTANWTNQSGIPGTTSYGSVASLNTSSAGTLATVNLNATGVAMIQGWIDNTAAKNGLSIKTDYSNNSTNSVLLCSSENATTGYRPTLDITYSSGGQAPEMSVSRADAVVADGGTDTVNNTVPGVGTQLSYTIANLGNANLTLTPPVTATPVSNCSITVNTQPTSTVVASSDTALVVTVTPTAAGSWSATLSITNNDSNEAPYNWTISGSATGSYSVSLDAQGGTGGSTSVSATLGLPMPSATAPTRTGYTFGGYYSSAGGNGTQYYTAAMTSAANWDIAAATTLYAKWTEVIVDVVTDTNTVNIPEGGTQSFQVKLSAQPSASVTVSVSRTSGDTDITVQSGTSLTFTTANWDTYQTVTLAAANDADADNGSATISCDASNAAYTDKNITANEVDKHTTLTIANDGNGTTLPSGAVIVEKNTATAIAATANTGYDFVNWTPTSGTANFADANSASTTATITAPTTIRANFALKTYTVTYNANGASSGTVPADQTKTHDVNLTLATNSGSLTKTGFTFAGWNTAADGTGTSYATGASYTANSAVTLYAKWNPGSADGTWIQTAAGPLNWGDTANWSGGIIATGVDKTAAFTPDITADQIINLDAARTIGNITFTDSTTSSHNLTISGANTLTLDRTSGVPLVDVTQTDRTLTIASIVAGSDGLEKSGAGMLTLSGASTYTGTTTISAGTLRLEGNAFSTAARNYSISSGAVLHQAGTAQTPTGTTTISGSGTLRGSFTNGIGSGRNVNLSLSAGGLIDIPSGGSIYNGGWAAMTWSSNQATLNVDGSLSIVDGNAITADALTGAGTITSSATTGSAANFTLGVANGSGSYGGTISAAGTRVISLVKSGTGTQTFSGSTTWKGTTTINGGTLQYAKTGSLYAGTTADWVKTKIIVNNGGTIAFNVGGANEFTTTDVTTLLTGLGGAVNNNGLRAGSTIAFDTGNASGGTFTIANTIANTTGTGGGAVGLGKLGTGTLTLSGPNTYTGPTTISGGTLLINGDQTAATGAVSVTANATLGGTGTIGGSTTIADGGKLEFVISTPTASHNSLELASAKTLTFSGASVLTINSTSGAETGTYTLLTAPGGISGVAPATLNLPSGWAATVSISGNSLVLNVTSVGIGPLDHFAISTIPSPQTVGTPITGITITAQDAANQTVTSFAGTVSFGGSGGFSGTSGNFVNGVLTNVSVTPTTAGSNLTFVVSDGAGHFGSATIATIQSLYTAWSGGTSFTDDSNGDGVKDGLAWVLGATNPSGSMQGKLPVASRNNDKLRLTFRCLKSTMRGGAQLHIQTSNDLGVTDPWTNHATLVPDTDQTVNGVIFDTTDDGDFIQVAADIPATEGKLFTRLVVTE